MTNNPRLPRYTLLAAPAENPTDVEALKREFSRRLQKAMVAKGWNQSQVAREASRHLPKSANRKDIGRDLVSNYLHARSLPRAEALTAMARAFGVKESDLMPDAAIPATSHLPSYVQDTPGRFSFRQLDDGRMRLTIDDAFPEDVAWQIIDILRGAQR